MKARVFCVSLVVGTALSGVTSETWGSEFQSSKPGPSGGFERMGRWEVVQSVYRNPELVGFPEFVNSSVGIHASSPPKFYRTRTMEGNAFSQGPDGSPVWAFGYSSNGVSPDGHSSARWEEDPCGVWELQYATLGGVSGWGTSLGETGAISTTQAQGTYITTTTNPPWTYVFTTVNSDEIPGTRPVGWAGWTARWPFPQLLVGWTTSATTLRSGSPGWEDIVYRLHIPCEGACGSQQPRELEFIVRRVPWGGGAPMFTRLRRVVADGESTADFLLSNLMRGYGNCVGFEPGFDFSLEPEVYMRRLPACPSCEGGQCQLGPGGVSGGMGSVWIMVSLGNAPDQSYLGALALEGASVGAELYSLEALRDASSLGSTVERVDGAGQNTGVVQWHGGGRIAEARATGSQSWEIRFYRSSAFEGAVAGQFVDAFTEPPFRSVRISNPDPVNPESGQILVEQIEGSTVSRSWAYSTTSNGIRLNESSGARITTRESFSTSDPEVVRELETVEDSVYGVVRRTQWLKRAHPWGSAVIEERLDPGGVDRVAAFTHVTSGPNVGRVASRTEPGGRVTTWTYDADGEVSSERLESIGDQSIALSETVWTNGTTPDRDGDGQPERVREMRASTLGQASRQSWIITHTKRQLSGDFAYVLREYRESLAGVPVPWDGPQVLVTSEQVIDTPVGAFGLHPLNGHVLSR